MRVLYEGTDAITFEPAGGTIRLLDTVPAAGDDKPRYFGAGQVRPLWGGVVMLAAFDASKLTRAHMRLVVRLLVEAGYTTLYVDRAEGHTIPMASRIEDGDFAGLWRLDLRAVPDRRVA